MKAKMTNDQAAGLWWGLFIGDAMGVPLEFTKPNMGEPVTTFTTGGFHNAKSGEYSDDGAMALAIAAAYKARGDSVAQRYKPTSLIGCEQESLVRGRGRVLGMSV